MTAAQIEQAQEMARHCKETQEDVQATQSDFSPGL
jgi:hypothetical protein